MKTIDITTLTETVLNTCRYMAQEPKAYVVICKERPWNGRHRSSKGESVAQAYIVDRVNKDVSFGHMTSQRINKASLAGMLTKGLLAPIERPENARTIWNEGAYISVQFARLSEAGIAIGKEVMASCYGSLTVKQRIKQEMEQANYSVTSAERALAKAQEAYQAALARQENATQAYNNTFSPIVLNDAQQAAFALCLAPDNREGNIVLEGVEENAAVMAALAQHMEDAGKNPEVAHITDTKSLLQAISSEIRPTLVLVENADSFTSHEFDAIKRGVRDGGRMIVSLSDLGLMEDFGFETVTIIKKDAHA